MGQDCTLAECGTAHGDLGERPHTKTLGQARIPRLAPPQAPAQESLVWECAPLLDLNRSAMTGP